MKTNFKVSDFKLERYLAGDLPQDEMQELRSREETDEIFQARVKMMREENAKILTDHPFEALSEKMAELDEGSITGRRMAVSTMILKVAAAVVLAVGIFTAGYFMNGENVVSGSTREAADGLDVAMVSAESETRIKGMSARLEIWRKNGTGIEQLADNSVAHENDELQLRYLVPEKCFGMLFSMDGNGTLTLHLGNNNEAIELEPGKMISLPFAYKLDNAPHFEKFFLLTSRNAFGVVNNDVDATLGQDGVEVTAITLAKQGGN